MQNVDIPALLRDLKGETSALSLLAYRLGEEIRETTARIEPPADGPTQRAIAMKYLASVSNQQLRADLREARGERSASCFKTKLHHDLKARTGHARVTNGNGAGTPSS